MTRPAPGPTDRVYWKRRRFLRQLAELLMAERSSAGVDRWEASQTLGVDCERLTLWERPGAPQRPTYPQAREALLAYRAPARALADLERLYARAARGGLL
ncbi:MAG: hypothetical protein AAFV53_26120 [Myxococcota bacterium]